jgi:Ca2+-binding RTX toxin-like protein
MNDGKDIIGETSATHTVTQEDVNKTISVKASYVDLLNTAEKVISTSLRVNNINDSPTGELTVQGIINLGRTLTAASSIVDIDGLDIFNYQWFADGEKINNATKKDYKLTSSELNKKISVQVNYTDACGTEEQVISQETLTTVIISLKPSVGDDLLIGTSKNDKINGLAGNDTIIGGLGKDILTGFTGADIFKFRAINEINGDTITDFKENDRDKIDLSDLDANTNLKGQQKFTLVSAFNTKDATGQLYFDTTKHILYGSINSNSKAEFSILLTGVAHLSIEDFIF